MVRPLCPPTPPFFWQPENFCRVCEVGEANLQCWNLRISEKWAPRAWETLVWLPVLLVLSLFCHCIARLVSELVLGDSSAWKVSPPCFLVAFSRRTSNSHSAGPGGCYWPAWESSKSWKERGTGLSWKNFGMHRPDPEKPLQLPTLEVAGCFSRGEERRHRRGAV